MRVLPRTASRYRRALRAIPLLLAVALLLPPASAQKPLDIDDEASQLRFEAKQMGVTMRGAFSDWSAEIAIDEAQPDASSARVVVQTASIDTGNADANREVKKEDWLAVEQFPEAVFESESVRRLEDGRWAARGPLRIRDVSHEVEVPFKFESLDDGRRRMHGELSIKRADYEVGGGAWGGFDVVANEVRIMFTVEAAP